jgi:poly(3-hydroxybutyrate) depolymerase
LLSKLGLLIGSIACALSFHAAAQPAVPGPQVATFFSDIDDTDQPYGLYLPKNFDPKKRYPLVISLHGALSNHRLNLKRIFGLGNKPGETDAEATRYFPPFPDVPYIVAAPLARGTLGYQGIPEKDVYDVLADVKRRFLIDEDRTYLTGLSMGGGGTLWIGLTRPDLWAAIAPVCPAAPVGSDILAPNALNLPVKIFQGDADPVVKPELVRAWRDRLQQAGVNVEYVEYPGVKHNSWDNAYANASIFEWFGRHKRNLNPPRVRYVTRDSRYAKAYWVTLDRFEPGVAASIDASIEKDELKVTTTNLEGFTATPKEKIRAVVIDGQRLTPKSLSFMKEGGQWKEGRAAAPAKKFGAMQSVISQRHIYVFGTADNPGAEEIARRRAEAEKLTDWSFVPRLPLLLTLRVLADRDVKPSDLAGANLVLLGTRETNSLIAAMDGKLPLRLKPDAADYTLVFAAHDGERSVLVMSGKPIPVAPRFIQATPLVNDYALLRGSETIAVGYFSADGRAKAALPDMVEVRP